MDNDQPHALLKVRRKPMPAKPKRAEVRLTDFISFEPGTAPTNLATATNPWPDGALPLLAEPTGDEAWIHPYEAWMPDDFERLGMYAMQYHDLAKHLVRAWIATGRRVPETYIYGIAFMYRHSIELQLKALIASDTTFRRRSARSKSEALYGHQLDRLWNRLRPSLTDLYDARELKHAGVLIKELNSLDERSDGFRYPFREEDGQRTRLAVDLGFKSAEVFIYGLEALSNWLLMVEDARELYQDAMREMGRP